MTPPADSQPPVSASSAPAPHPDPVHPVHPVSASSAPALHPDPVHPAHPVHPVPASSVPAPHPDPVHPAHPVHPVPASSPLLSTQSLSRSYKMGSNVIHALQNVTLEIYPGEFVALMGASGSGKSTLLHLLGCLDTPSSGSYQLEGREVARLSKNERSRLRNERIGFIFQNFNLLPRLSALENVALPLLYRRSPSPHPVTSSPSARAAATLAQVGLADRARHLPTELSGGERQRVAIARALVTSPAILLADEPTGNLDSATGAEIIALLRDLAAQGRTILLVTHDPQVARHAHRTLTMKDGRLQSPQPLIPNYPIT